MLKLLCEISDRPKITLAFIGTVLLSGDFRHTVDFIHIMVKFNKHVHFIALSYIRKGVMIDGLWQEMRDQEGSKKESNKKEISRVMYQAGRQFARRIFVG